MALDLRVLPHLAVFQKLLLCPLIVVLHGPQSLHGQPCRPAAERSRSQCTQGCHRQQLGGGQNLRKRWARRARAGSDKQLILYRPPPHRYPYTFQRHSHIAQVGSHCAGQQANTSLRSSRPYGHLVPTEESFCAPSHRRESCDGQSCPDLRVDIRQGQQTPIDAGDEALETLQGTAGSSRSQQGMK